MKTSSKVKLLSKPHFYWPKPVEYFDDYETIQEFDSDSCVYDEIPEGATHFYLETGYDNYDELFRPRLKFCKFVAKKRNPNYDKLLEEYNKKWSEYQGNLKAYQKQERERKKKEKEEREQSERAMYEMLKAKYENE